MNNKTLKFISLDTIIEKESQSKIFKKTYDEELTRLRIAQQIKRLRVQMGMTQLDLAEKVTMPQSVIARIESGQHPFTLGTLDRIAHVLGKKIELV